MISSCTSQDMSNIFLQKKVNVLQIYSKECIFLNTLYKNTQSWDFSCIYTLSKLPCVIFNYNRACGFHFVRLKALKKHTTPARFSARLCLGVRWECVQKNVSQIWSPMRLLQTLKIPQCRSRVLGCASLIAKEISLIHETSLYDNTSYYATVKIKEFWPLLSGRHDLCYALYWLQKFSSVKNVWWCKFFCLWKT